MECDPLKYTVMLGGKIVFRSLFGIISTVTISVCFVFSLWATYYVFNNNTHIYAENGLLETLQAGLLAITCISFLVDASLEKRPKNLILLACSLLCYSFLLRELDVEKFDVPDILKMIGSGYGRNTTIAVGFFAIFTYAALSNYSYYKKAAISFIKSRPGLLLISGGILLLIADFFEGQRSIAYHVFIEELFELFAFVLIMLSSLAANPHIVGTTIRSSGSDKAP